MTTMLTPTHPLLQVLHFGMKENYVYSAGYIFMAVQGWCTRYPLNWFKFKLHKGWLF